MCVCVCVCFGGGRAKVERWVRRLTSEVQETSFNQVEKSIICQAK